MIHSVNYLNTFQMDLCYFCGQIRSPNNGSVQLYQNCGCRRRSHIHCLIRHIQNTHHNHCELCFVPFQNVRIIYPNRSCSNWLREDQMSRQLLTRLLTVALLIIYLEYLSLIQLAVQYQYMSKLEIYFIQFCRYTFLFVLFTIVIFIIIFMTGSYFTFRRAGHLNVLSLIDNENINQNLIIPKQIKDQNLIHLKTSKDIIY